MAKDSENRADSVLCPSCGLSQDRSKSHCRRCGAPLAAPGQIYRKLPDGRWSALDDISLASLAPKPPPQPRKWFTRQRGVAMAALAVLILGSFWYVARKSAESRKAQIREVAQYLHLPVGRIVPQFQLRVEKNTDGSVRVSGDCNLPPQTQLEVRVLFEGRLVAVDYPVSVTAGSFSTRTLLDRGRPFDAGTYQAQVKADFGQRWQPPAVLLVVGNVGERLGGPLVERHGSSSEAELVYTQDFSLD